MFRYDADFDYFCALLGTALVSYDFYL